MSRYKFWTKKKLDKLKNETLFQEKLLPDIERGIVFPTLRGKQAHFYCNGRKLFGYTPSGGFQTNVAFAVAIAQKKKGEVKEKDLSSLKLIDNFKAGYNQIKKNTRLHKEDESLEVSQLCKHFSIAKRKANGPIRVLDVELSLESFDEDRSQDRIDLVMLNKEENEIRFFEVKLLRDSRLRAKKGEVPEVVAQLERYNAQVNKRRKELRVNYLEYLEKLSYLLEVKLGNQFKVDPKVDLLLFGYKQGIEEKKARAFKSKLNKEWGHFCSLKGSVGTTDISTTLSTLWWPRN